MNAIKSEQVTMAYCFFAYVTGENVLFLYSYVTVKPLVRESRMKTARILWIDTVILWAIYRAMFTLNNLLRDFSPESLVLVIIKSILRSFVHYPLFLGIIIVAFIAIWYPETVIYSKAQLIRAIGIYQEVVSLEPKTAIKHLGIASIVDYIHSIPPEIIDSL